MSEDPVPEPDPGAARPPERADVAAESPMRMALWWVAFVVVIGLVIVVGVVSVVPTRDRTGVSIASDSRRSAPNGSVPVRDPSSPTVSMAASPSGTTTPVASNDDEVCGLHGVVSDVAHPLTEDPAFAARIRASHQRLAELLASHPDERSRVVAHLLNGIAQEEIASADRARSNAEQCGSDTACLAAKDADDATAALAVADRPDTDAIARAASTTRDPFVYATAINVCQKARSVSAPACQLVNAAQWARMDPDNVFAWLHVADDAASRKDVDALDDAMNHVARAKTSLIYANMVAGIVEAAVPADAREFEAGQMREFAWGSTSTWVFPSFQTVVRYCALAALQDTNRLQVCNAIAHRLVDNGSTFIERGIGITVGTRVGWSADDIAVLRRDNGAMQSAQLLTAFTELAPESCHALGKARTALLDIARLGEVGAAKAAMAASGKSAAKIDAEMQERIAAWSARVPAASAPASAASSV